MCVAFRDVAFREIKSIEVKDRLNSSRDWGGISGEREVADQSV